jgi:hypothetical protein
LTSVCLNAPTLSLSRRESLADPPSIAVIVRRLAGSGPSFGPSNFASRNGGSSRPTIVSGRSPAMAGGCSISLPEICAT